MLLNDLRLSVMEEFIMNYSATLTGSQIARKRGLNQKSVANILKQMEKDCFLKSRLVGKNRQFSLNLEDGEIITNFISSVEHLRTVKFLKKNTVVKEIITKIKPSCNGIIVIFGSYAKGNQRRDSDLDVFIVGSYDKNKVDKITEAYGLNLSIKNYSKKVFNSVLSKKDILLTEIIKDHIIVSQVQEFVARVLRFYYGKA